MWVGGVADSKQAPNHTENSLFDPNFTFCVPKSHKNPGVGAWVLIEDSSIFFPYDEPPGGRGQSILGGMIG